MPQAKILIIEDDAIVAQEFAAHCRSWGHEVIGISPSGPRALELSSKTNPTVAVIDIGLKGPMDGIDTASHIRREHGSAIVYVTGRTEADLFERAKKTEPSAYITKPVTISDLQRAIDLAVTRHELETRLVEANEGLEQKVRDRAFDLLRSNDLLRQEIAERKDIEASLRKSEARFRVIFEQAAVGVAEIVSRTGEFVSINRRYCDIVGYTVDEMLTMTFQDITHPEDLQPDLDNMARLTAGEIREFTMEKRYLRKDGSIVWVTLAVTPMWAPGEEPTHHIAVVEDITARKQAEENLRKALDETEHKVAERTTELSQANERLREEIAERERAEQALAENEAKYRLLFDLANDAIFMHPMGSEDHMFPFLEVNRVACEITGFSREELLDRTPLDIMSEPDRSNLEDERQALLETNELLFEKTLVSKDGKHIPVEIHARVFNYNDRPVAISIARDISKRKQEEEQIKFERERLRRVLEIIPGFVSLQAPDYTIKYGNKKFTELFGLHEGRTCHEMICNEQVPCDRCPAREVLDDGKPREREWTSTDGRTYRTYLSAFTDSDGSALVLKMGIDVTEAKQAEAAVQGHLVFLESLLKAIPNPVFYKNLDGVYIECNAAFEDFIGLNRGDILGKTVFDVASSSLAALYHEKDQKLFQSADIQVYEAEVEDTRGNRRTVVFHKAPFFDTQGDLAGLIGTILDITERKRAEEALLESEARLDLALKSAEIGLWDADIRTGRVVRNEISERMHGHAPGEMPPTTGEWLAAMHPEDQIEARKQFIACKEGERNTIDLEYRTTHPSGKTAQILSRGKVVERSEDGTAVRIIGTVQDISARKAAEIALRRNERFLTGIFDAIQDGLSVTDPDYTILRTNKTMERMFPDKLPLAGKKCFDVYHDRSEVCSECPVKQTLVTKEPASETITCRGSDSAIWAYVTVYSYPLIDEDSGELTGVVEYVKDVTEQKKSEEIVRQSLRYRAVADLASGVAHNFNNLLQIVLGNANLALLNLQSGEFSEMQESLEQIVESARFGAETVRRLSTFAKAGDGDRTASDEVFDVRDLVRQAIQMTRPWWKEEPRKRGSTVVVREDLAADCYVSGSKNELFEVSVNLLKNAAEALPKGGAIDVSLKSKDDRVELKVSDDGIGLSSDDLDRLFTPFFTTKLEAGTGLGLAVSRSIVDRHGGHIIVESVEGEGTVVTVTLPRARQVSQSPAVSADKTHSAPFSALVIDDMEPVLTMVKNGLEKHGHTVHTALTGQDGLDIAREIGVDIIICDLGMPTMSGWRVGKAVKDMCGERGIPKIPFIILTGWAEQDKKRKEIEESGVDAVVEKPVSMARLLEIIRDLLY
jgi:PAS domain S-box-containing protein